MAKFAGLGAGRAPRINVVRYGGYVDIMGFELASSRF